MPPESTDIAVLQHQAAENKEKFNDVWHAIEKLRERMTAVEARVSLIVGVGIAANVLVNVFNIGGK